jgi:hypothetical protein
MDPTMLLSQADFHLFGPTLGLIENQELRMNLVSLTGMGYFGADLKLALPTPATWILSSAMSSTSQGGILVTSGFISTWTVTGPSNTSFSCLKRAMEYTSTQ